MHQKSKSAHYYVKDHADCIGVTGITVEFDPNAVVKFDNWIVRVNNKSNKQIQISREDNYSKV